MLQNNYHNFIATYWSNVETFKNSEQQMLYKQIILLNYIC